MSGLSEKAARLFVTDVGEGSAFLVASVRFPADAAEAAGSAYSRIAQFLADLHPDIVRDLEARLLKYAREMKPAEWIKAQPAFLGAQGKTILDPDFDIDDGGLPHEKPALPRG
jgi:hypothetical protein